jgi:hypothetical protein
METKHTTFINTKPLKNAVMLALLFTVGLSNAWSATQAEDQAKGEQMLRQARTDITEANRLAAAADALTTQATTAASEAAVLQQRIAPVQTEVNRLTTSIANLTQAAQRLAPAAM